MAKQQIDARIAAELRALALLADEDIDTSDIPEKSDWSNAVRARFANISVNERGYDIRAIANWVLDYFADIDRMITNMSLNKLVYFLIERGLVERRVLFSPARVEAWDHGPVFREIYQAVKSDDKPITKRITRYSVVDRENIEAREQFSPDDLDFFRSVVLDYGSFTASQLRGISHRKGGPWDRVWSSANRINPGMVISTSLILSSASMQRDHNGRN